MSISFIGGVFTDINQSGTGALIGLGKSNRYNKFPNSTMLSMGISHNLSSATLYSSSDCDATVIFFGFPWWIFPNYTGSFMQITNKKNSGSEFDLNNFSSAGFNDLATSMLCVGTNRAGTEFRLSFRDLFLEQWKTMIDKKLDGSEAKRAGDPILTWEMWPNGISYLSSNCMYLKVHQDLTVELHCWPDYSASITYHIHLYLDGSNHLKGYTARWAYWVESGVKSGDIADALEPKVINGMSDLDNQLTEKLGPFSAFSFKDIYFLPGNQVTAPSTGVITGYTTDDITIVVVP